MLITSYPSPRLRLSPSFSSDGTTLFIKVLYKVAKPNVINAGQALFEFETVYGNVPSHPYVENDIQASDHAGPLLINFTHGGQQNLRKWHVQRDMIGDASLTMTVYPRPVNSATPPGPLVDMRAEGKGLKGVGCWFLPKVLQTEQNFTNIVEWDLSKALKNIRAVRTYGEGPASVIHLGPANTLLNSIYIVGPLRSLPPCRQLANDTGSCTMYCFETLPANLAEFTEIMFVNLCRMFRSDISAYRIFSRSGSAALAGRAFEESYLVKYRPDTAYVPNEEIRNLFAHKMVYSFVWMDLEEDGDENA